MSEKRFRPLHYSTIPNEVIDEMMADLSGAAFKVLLYILRRTFGFHCDSANISIRDMCHGLVNSRGQRLDGGTGLSRGGVLAAIAELEEKRLILVRRRKAVDGQHLSNTYTIVVETDEGAVGGDGQPEVIDNQPGFRVVEAGKFEHDSHNGGVVQKIDYVAQPIDKGVVQKLDHLNKERKKEQRKKAAAIGSQADLDELYAAAAEAISHHVKHVDTATPVRIVAAALAQMPDITPSQLAHTIHELVPKGKRIRGAGFFVTEIGHLLASDQFRASLKPVEQQTTIRDVYVCEMCNSSGIMGVQPGAREGEYKLGTPGFFKTRIARGYTPCTCQIANFLAEFSSDTLA